MSNSQQPILRKRQKLLAAFLLPATLFTICYLKFDSSFYSSRSVVIFNAGYITSALVFSPKGDILAGGEGSASTGLKLWNFPSGHVFQLIKTHHNAAIEALAFSPDGRVITTCGNSDGRLFSWNTTTGNRISQLSGLQDETNSLFYSPNNKFLINAGYEGGGYGSAEGWDVKTNQLLYRLQGKKGNVFAAMMPDGKTFLTTSRDATQIHDLKTGRVLRAVSIVKDQREFLKAVLSPNGKTLALCTRQVPGGEEITELWDMTTGKLRRSWRENAGNKNGPWRGAVQALTFSPDSQLLVSSSRNQPVRVWDAQNGTVRATLKLDAQSLAFSPDGKTLAVAIPRQVQLWKVKALLQKEKTVNGT